MRLDHRGVGGDEHLLADRAKRKRHIDLGVRVDLQDDAILDVGGEALQCHLELIGADRKTRQRVAPIRTRECRPHEPGVGLRNRDLGARKRAAAGITNDSRYLGAGNRLRGRGGSGKRT